MVNCICDKIRSVSKKVKAFAVSREEEPKLTDQFFVTLRCNIEQLKKSGKQVDEDLVNAIEGILEKDEKTWKDAYEVERLITQLYDDRSLEVELERRLVEAKRNLFDDEYTFYKSKLENLNSEMEPNIELKFAILNRLINDLQWRYTINQTKRVYTINVRGRVSGLFIISTILFLLTITLYSFDNNFYIYISLVTGFWGASFSLLTSLNEKLNQSGFDDLRLLFNKKFILSRTIIGAGASLILYFFLQAEMVRGSIFPDIDLLTSTTEKNPIDYKNFSLLVLWSFISGFSEKLVPNLLADTEKKVNIKKE